MSGCRSRDPGKWSHVHTASSKYWIGHVRLPSYAIRSHSVGISDERNDEFRVADTHAETSPRIRRCADVSGVITARSRVVLDRCVFLLIAAAWYSEPSRGRMSLVDGRFHHAVGCRTRRPSLQAVVVETSQI